MSGDSENPDDLIFDDESFPSDSEEEEAGKKEKVDEEVVFSDEAEAARGDGGEPDHADSAHDAGIPEGYVLHADTSGEDLQQDDIHHHGVEPADEGHAEAVPPADQHHEPHAGLHDDHEFVLHHDDHHDHDHPESVDAEMPAADLGHAEPLGDDEMLPVGDIEAALTNDPGTPARRGADHEGEDQILFGDQSVDEPSEAFDPGKEPFAEETGAGWEGHFMPADQIGIPTNEGGEEDLGFDESDPLASDMDQDFDLGLEDEELQLVEDESELHAAETEEPAPLEAAVSEGAVRHGGTEEGWLVEAEAEEEHEEEHEAEFVLADYAEGEFDQPEGEASYADDGDDAGDDYGAEYVLDESGGAEVDPEWAPVASGASLDDADDAFVLQDDEDTVYGSEVEDAEQPEAVGYEEPEFAEYAESYVEGADPFAEATEGVEAPPRRFRLVRLLSGLAAASILIAAGTVMVLKPELLGLKLKPEIVDRVQIDRPQPDLGLTTPEVELPPDPVVPDPITPDPVTPDPIVPDPITPDPVTPDPIVPDPITPDPVTPDPITPDPLIPDPDPIPEELGTFQLGETGILIGDEATENRRNFTIGVSVGSQAFAQLHNGNYFVGVVKSVGAAETVTLRVPNGEVTLGIEELKTLAPLGSKEYQALQEADQGYVRLVNNSLLRGTVLRNTQDDNVILQMKSNLVLIPQEDVDEVGSGQPTAVQLDDSGDMDWVRRLVEEGMEQDEYAPLPEGDPKRPEVRVKIDR